MVAKKGKDWNFSGWIRARIRQMDEGVDPVELDIAYQSMKLYYKTLSAAIYSCFPHSADFTAEDVFFRFNEMMAQRSLEDFE